MATGVAEDLKAYLVAQGIGGTIRNGALGPETGAMVGIVAYGGMPPITAMGSHNVVVRRFSVQILVRGPKADLAAAVTTMEAIYAVVAQAINVSANGHTYDKIVAAGEPFSLRPDDSDRPLLALNVEAWRRGIT